MVTATPADGSVGFGYGTTTDGLHWTSQPPAKVHLPGLTGSQLEVGGVTLLPDGKFYAHACAIEWGHVAGLGGCPYAKGATGNVATEDVVYMCEGLGVRTGVDLEALVDVGAFITDELGKVSRSRAANAIVAKRKMREEAQKRAAAKAAKGEPTKEHPMN